MAVKTQNISIDFGLGIDEFTDPKMVQPGKLLTAKNVVFNENKKIEKRNGYKEVPMNMTEGGEPITAPQEIFLHNRNPVVFSKNRIQTSIRSNTISDAVRWRDSGEFNLPVEVTTNLVSPFNSTGDRVYDEDDLRSTDSSNISIASETIETNDTLVKCTAYCTSERGGLGVVVRDVVTNEILVQKSDILDNITIPSTGRKLTWRCPRIIPWRSVGLEPDKFIIVVSSRIAPYKESAALFPPNDEYDEMLDYRYGDIDPYQVVIVTLDSLGSPHIEEAGDLFSWLGWGGLDPVQADYINYYSWDGAEAPEDVQLLPDAVGYMIRKYSQWTDFLYDKDTSTAWFIFGGTGVTISDQYAYWNKAWPEAFPGSNSALYDIQWGQRVYAIKITQGGGSSFIGNLHARSEEAISDSRNAPELVGGGTVDNPYENVWEQAFGNPNVIPDDPDIPQKPRWGSYGVDFAAKTKEFNSGVAEEDLGEHRSIQPYCFDEIFRISANFIPGTTDIVVAASSVCRDQNNYGAEDASPGTPWTLDAITYTEQRTFALQFDITSSDLSVKRTDLTRCSSYLSGNNERTLSSSSDLIGTHPRTPQNFMCSGIHIVPSPISSANRDYYLVYYFEEQINNGYLRKEVLTEQHSGGGRGFFSVVMSTLGWNVSGQAVTKNIYSDVMEFTKIAASPTLLEHGPNNDDYPENDRLYLVLPTVKKNIELMSRGAMSGDIYIIGYDSGTIAEGNTDGLDRGHCLAKILDGRALGATSDPISVGRSYMGTTSSFGTKNIFDFPTYSTESDVGLNEVISDFEPKINAIEFGGNLYTSGGYLKSWDGDNYIENNFHFAPPILDINHYRMRSGHLGWIGKGEKGYQIPINPPDFVQVNRNIRFENLINMVGYSTARLLTQTGVEIPDLDGGEISPFSENLFIDTSLGAAKNAIYQFCFVYEWVDGNGNKHQSTPSEIVHISCPSYEDFWWFAPPGEPSSLIINHDNPEIGKHFSPGPSDWPVEPQLTPAINFRIGGLPRSFTEKNSIESVSIKAYRTVNLSGEEPFGVQGAFYEDTLASVQACYEVSNRWGEGTGDDEPSAQYDTLVYGVNTDPYGSTSRLSYDVTFSVPDDIISLNPMLYTTGGIAAYTGAPPCKQLSEHDGRLFVLSSENPYMVNYSNQLIKYSSIQYNMYNKIATKKAGGPLVGLASNAGKLILFKERSIFVTYGTPRGANGWGGGYSPPQEFSEDIGCTNPSSISETDEGVFFQSGRDVYLIDKGYNLNKIGIVAQLEEGQEINTVLKLPRSNEIRFCHNDGMLIYNTLFKQWTTSDLGSIGSSVLVGEDHYLIDSTGRKILKEDANHYGDIDEPITTDIETAWIKMNTPQGPQRIKNILFLGDLSENTSFNLEIYYNYNKFPGEIVSVTASDICSLETPEDWSTWGTDDTWGGNKNDHVFQFRHKPKIQKCESIKFRIVENGLLTSTKGYALNTMLLEVASKRGSMKLKESKTV